MESKEEGDSLMSKTITDSKKPEDEDGPDGVENSEAPEGNRKFGPSVVSDRINYILTITAMATAFVSLFLCILARLIFCAFNYVFVLSFLCFGCCLASYVLWRVKHEVCNLAIFVLSVLGLVFGVAVVIWSLFLIATCDSALVKATAAPKTTKSTPLNATDDVTAAPTGGGARARLADAGSGDADDERGGNEDYDDAVTRLARMAGNEDAGRGNARRGHAGNEDNDDVRGRRTRSADAGNEDDEDRRGGRTSLTDAENEDDKDSVTRLARIAGNQDAGRGNARRGHAGNEDDDEAVTRLARMAGNEDAGRGNAGRGNAEKRRRR